MRNKRRAKYSWALMNPIVKSLLYSLFTYRG
jgi:hypothetical protein